METRIRKTALALIVAACLGTSCAHAGTRETLRDVLEAAGGSEAARNAATGALSESEMTAGLKEALARGVETAIETLGRTDGFLGDALVRIPVPEKVSLVEQAARRLGQGQYADQFVASMNRAAERAVPEAADILGNAIRAMSVEDAARIVGGPEDAATRYFRATSESTLTARFLPIVRDATESVGVTAAYKSLTDRAGGTLGGIAAAAGLAGMGGTGQELDLDRYVTDKALDGLFTYIALEEKRIRENPMARTSDLLKRVFGR